MPPDVCEHGWCGESTSRRYELPKWAHVVFMLALAVHVSACRLEVRYWLGAVHLPILLALPGCHAALCTSSRLFIVKSSTATMWMRISFYDMHVEMMSQILQHVCTDTIVDEDPLQ
jgi:hypothetical protein